MEINKIISTIETFAPLELQSSWDCSGWVINNGQCEVEKILLALTVDEKIIDQAIEKNCELIISHHPLFSVPLSFQKGVSIYSAHTNLDVVKGGTTDSLISLLGLGNSTTVGEFLRVVDLEKEILMSDFVQLLKNKLNLGSVKVVNKSNLEKIKKISFCAGSGADFLNEVQELNADVFVTMPRIFTTFTKMFRCESVLK